MNMKKTRYGVPLAVLILSSPYAVAELDATKPVITQQKNNDISLKRKVAISRFSNETKAANTFLVDSAGDKIGKQASDILSARLTETGKFLMFERQDKQAVDAENGLKDLKSTGVNVDYLIVGSVSEFGRSVESDTGMFQRSKTQKAYTKVNARLIEVSTGRIISSVEGAGEATSSSKKTFGSGSDAGYDQSLTDKALSAAISQMITNISDEMTASPWKSFILSKEDNAYLIAGGQAQGLKANMKLNVVKRGKQVKNPQTGALIELPGKNVAVLNVDLTHGEDEWNQLSFTSIESGSIDGELDQYIVTEQGN